MWDMISHDKNNCPYPLIDETAFLTDWISFHLIHSKVLEIHTRKNVPYTFYMLLHILFIPEEYLMQLMCKWREKQGQSHHQPADNGSQSCWFSPTQYEGNNYFFQCLQVQHFTRTMQWWRGTSTNSDGWLYAVLCECDWMDVVLNIKKSGIKSPEKKRKTFFLFQILHP